MIRILALIFFTLGSCAADGASSSSSATQNPSKATSTSPPTAARSTNGTSASDVTTSTKGATTATKREEPAAVFERIKAEITKCYDAGRVGTPTMLDGKLTLNASVEASGKIGCVIPTDDSGLTQEVEDCMSSKLAAVVVAAGPEPWSLAVPILVRGGSVQPGTLSPNSAAAGIESVETHRMADAFEALEALVPDLQACMQSVDRSVVARQSFVVGARVNLDGRTACALATGTGLPPKATECVASLFIKTKFPPPKGGMGLILVPITLTKR